jgi:hypothetical protein
MSRVPGATPLFLAVPLLIAAVGCSSSVPGGHGSGMGGSPTSGAGGAAVGGGAGNGGSGGGAGGIAGVGIAGSPGGAGIAGAGGGVASASAGSGSGGTTGGAGSGGGTTGAGGSGDSCLGHDIDLRATTVSGTLTVNGVSVTDATTKGGGNFFLRNAGDSALIGGTTGPFSALVFPGTYDLYYSQATPGPAVPTNTLAKIQSGIVVGATPLSLSANVAGTKVSGTVTVNGAAVNGAAKGAGSLRLVNDAGDAADLTVTSPTGGSYSALVVPGTYDLYYGVTSDGTAVPSNASAKIQGGIVVGASPLSLDVDVPASTVSITITFNGAAATGSQAQGTLTLRDAAGDAAQIATYSPSTGAYSGRVVPGTYDLYWAGVGSNAPSNTSVRIQSGVVVGTSALSLKVDVPATTVSGTATVNGAARSDFGTGITVLTLRGVAGDTVPLSLTSTGSYSTRVVPGSYDLYYSRVANNDAPRNSSAKLRSGIVVGGSALALDIDVPATTVSGAVTINGGATADPGKNAFVLSLKNADGDSVDIANFPRGGSYSANVIAGTYDLYYISQGNNGLDVPNNGLAKLRTGIVVGSSPLTLDVDVPGTVVSGAITVNGVANVGSPGDLAFVALSDSAGDVAGLASAASTTGTYSAFVVPGRYELYYILYRGGPSLPTNTNFHLGCFVVP